jgi:subtilisin family serine protease
MDTTDSQGLATTLWTLGSVAGGGRVIASGVGASGAATADTFRAVLTADMPDTLLLVSGDSQTAQVGQQLALPLVVLVRDSFSNAVPGAAVRWHADSTTSSGTLSNDTVYTSAQGLANVSWSLGGALGTQGAVAVLPVRGDSIRFTATGTLGSPTNIVSISGEGQTLTVGAGVFPQPLVAQVTDAFAHPVPGVPVTWGIDAGVGSLSGSSFVSDSVGLVSTMLSVDTVAGGISVVVAIPNVTLLRMGVSALPDVPAGLKMQLGDNQSGFINQLLPQVLVARLIDRYGNGLPSDTIWWRVDSGGGSLSNHLDADTSLTDAAGYAVMGWTLGPSGGVQIAAAFRDSLAGSPISFVAFADTNAYVYGNVALVNGFLFHGPPALASRPAPDRPMPLRGGAPQLPARDNELVVTYRAAALATPPIGSAALATPSQSQTARESIAARLGASVPLQNGRARVLGVSPVLLAARVLVLDGTELDAVRSSLLSDPAVLDVQRNPMLRTHGVPVSTLDTVPDDPLYPWQAWHYRMVDLPKAWTVTTGSASVLVAVIDDGTRFDHPGIAANLTGDGWDFASPVPLPQCGGGTIDNAGDGDGYDGDPTAPNEIRFDNVNGCYAPGPVNNGNHGLHVAGTIGAVGNDGSGVTGANWTVRVRPVRALGIGGVGTYYDVAQGILYAAGLPADDGHGGTVSAPSMARIINMSFGGTDTSTVLANAVTAAANAGALLVASSGNDGADLAVYPAALPQVVSVAAVGPFGNRAPYSNSHPSVDLAAPGGDLAAGDTTWGIMSTAWDFVGARPIYSSSWSGTSMAAPHVSGIAALLLADNPTLTPAALADRLTTYAVDAGPAGQDGLYGAGIVNAYNSLMQTHGSSHALFAILYDYNTGIRVDSQALDASGDYRFVGVPNGEYYVFAGADENGDGLVGLPGRPWSVSEYRPLVTGANNYFGGNISVGYPAGPLVVGGYVMGRFDQFSGAFSYSLRIPISGTYTFETSAVDGTCGLAIESDTQLRVAQGFTDLAFNDDIGPTNRCSRITIALMSGMYDVVVSGTYGRFRLQARSGN